MLKLFFFNKYDFESKIMNLWIAQVYYEHRLNFSLKTLHLIAHPLVSAPLKTTPWTNHDPKS